MTGIDEEKLEKMAKVCHEANRAFCESIGDTSQKSWEQAEQWQKDSAIEGVKFRLLNPDAPPSAQHNNWMRQKLEAGWVYGETKDAEKKTHHCIVPFENLPPDQQKKDHLFQGIVKALAW